MKKRKTPFIDFNRDRPESDASSAELNPMKWDDDVLTGKKHVVIKKGESGAILCLKKSKKAL